MLDQIQHTWEDQVHNQESLEVRYNKWLGKQGKITQGFKGMKSLSPEEKKNQGSLLKEARTVAQGLYDTQKNKYIAEHIYAQLLDDPLDISVRTKHKRGYLHLIAQERRHIERVAQHLGMRIEYGHELVTKYENFASVNIPDHHPAVEMHDTIYVDHPYVEEDLLLRTHTSAQQVAYLQEYETPLSLLSIGRVYRHEKLDATHDSAFWQIEGMVVDRGITVEHCVSFLQEFLDAIFGEHFRIRVRPAYFPFVEPGFEIDVNYAMGSQSGDDHRVELLGAGMIHPHILTEAGVNPETHSGFAFGIGLSRLVAIKHQIKDIRLFTNGDMRFVQSF